eukprot:GHVR01076895.1.p1 GENE.GHVR01076895.1~~GHVR01076895.1.p1  ORF type:complete len:161 (-),score=8.08 GHVR01076895.1:390-872(-)
MNINPNVTTRSKSNHRTASSDSTPADDGFHIQQLAGSVDRIGTVNNDGPGQEGHTHTHTMRTPDTIPQIPVPTHTTIPEEDEHNRRSQPDMTETEFINQITSRVTLQLKLADKLAISQGVRHCKTILHTQLSVLQCSPTSLKSDRQYHLSSLTFRNIPLT